MLRAGLALRSSPFRSRRAPKFGAGQPGGLGAFDARPSDMNASEEFAGLYQRYSDTVYRTALRVTGNPADAEDVLQTVFIRILNQGERLDLATVPEGYFRRAATNAAVDIIRRKCSRGDVQLDETLPHAAHDSPVLLKEQLRRAISTLDSRDAEVFLLRYVEGLSNGEIAEMFDVEKTTIAVRLHRIRHELQAAMER